MLGLLLHLTQTIQCSGTFCEKKKWNLVVTFLTTVTLNLDLMLLLTIYAFCCYFAVLELAYWLSIICLFIIMRVFEVSRPNFVWQPKPDAAVHLKNNDICSNNKSKQCLL